MANDTRKGFFRFEDLILFEDDYIICVNKPAGIATLAERNQPETGLLELARKYYPQLQVCHRLDKQTTGTLLFAKKPKVYSNIAGQFEHREVEKIYKAILSGQADWGEGIQVTAPLSTNKKGTTGIDFKAGKPAETRFRTEKIYSTATLVSAKPITGRSHQIRVHAAYLEHPLIGDSLYRGPELLLSTMKRRYKATEEEERSINIGFVLHAASLALTHPITEQPIKFEAPESENLLTCIKVLERWGSL